MDTDMSGNGAEAEAAANEAAKNSKKNCRVYVGNLNFQVKREDLKDFMRDGGSNLLFPLPFIISWDWDWDWVLSFRLPSFGVRCGEGVGCWTEGRSELITEGPSAM